MHLPALLLAVGVVGMMGAVLFRTRRPRDARFWVLFVPATAVFVASVVAFVVVQITAAMHMCD
jgi:hypothetical protein